GVGFDIACGNAAIRTDLTAEAIHPHRLELAHEIQRSIAFGVGRTNRADDAPVDDPLFSDAAWGAIPDDHLIDKARDQLGTGGSGNPSVDVLSDERGTVWVGVHFGSRGLGHTIASGFMALSRGHQGAEVEALLPLGSPLGADYWAAMNLAGRYAYVG